MHKAHGLLLAAAFFAIASCSTPGGGPLGFVLFDKNQHVPGAGSLFAPDEEGCVTASFLLSTFSYTREEAGERPACQRLRVRLQSALKADLFAPGVPDANGDWQRRRNEAIGTLIAASNDKCGAYVQFLQAYQGNVRATSGITAQATAILATVATGGLAQGFAAASGIASGAGNSLHQAHFANQTVAILTKAFDNKRVEQLRDMDSMMQCSPAQYPFSRAFADVQRYHASCSIVVGLQETQEAVEQKSSPNLDTYKQLLKELPEMQKLMAAASGASAPATAEAGTAEPKKADGTAEEAKTPAQAKPPAAGKPDNAAPQPQPGRPGLTAPVCPFASAQKAAVVSG
jgi:hypothetical protein